MKDEAMFEEVALLEFDDFRKWMELKHPRKAANYAAMAREQRVAVGAAIACKKIEAIGLGALS